MNYEQRGNRYTAIFVKCEGGFRRAPFDLVRFNVDENPDAGKDIVPVGQTDEGKIFETIWRVDAMPFTGKHNFGG